MWLRVSPYAICTLSTTEDHNARTMVAKQERKRSEVPRELVDFQPTSYVVVALAGLLVCAGAAPRVAVWARTTII